MTAETTAETTAVRRRPGGRSAAVRQAVHLATISLLEDVGYDGFELPEVALRAGVNKTTVYRRWPTKSQLIGDVLDGLATAQVAAPDTGTLREDLRTFLTDLAATLQTRVAKAVLQGSMPRDDEDPSITTARAAFWDGRFRQNGVMVERAIDRGELPADTDPRLFLQELGAPLYFRLVIIGEPVDAPLIDTFVTHIVNAHHPRPPARRR